MPSHHELEARATAIVHELPEREAIAYLIHVWDQTEPQPRNRAACLALAADLLRAQEVYRVLG